MLDVLESAGGELKQAGEAERRAIEEMRATGRELLGVVPGAREATVLGGSLPTSVRGSEDGMAISSMPKGERFQHWTR